MLDPEHSFLLTLCAWVVIHVIHHFRQILEMLNKTVIKCAERTEQSCYDRTQCQRKITFL